MESKRKFEKEDGTYGVPEEVLEESNDIICHLKQLSYYQSKIKY